MLFGLIVAVWSAAWQAEEKVPGGVKHRAAPADRDRGCSPCFCGVLSPPPFQMAQKRRVVQKRCFAGQPQEAISDQLISSLRMIWLGFLVGVGEPHQLVALDASSAIGVRQWSRFQNRQAHGDPAGGKQSCCPLPRLG